MSSNMVDKDTGELVTLSSGVRCWIGTKTAHDIAVATGTIGNNILVCITDDYASGDSSGKATRGSALKDTCNLFYTVHNGICTVVGNIRVNTAISGDVVAYTGLPKPLIPEGQPLNFRGLAFQSDGTLKGTVRAVDVNANGELSFMWGSRDWATLYEDSNNESYVILTYPVA